MPVYSVSWGRDYRRNGRVYEYCIFKRDTAADPDGKLIFRAGGFRSTGHASAAGLKAAAAIADTGVVPVALWG